MVLPVFFQIILLIKIQDNQLIQFADKLDLPKKKKDKYASVRMADAVYFTSESENKVLIGIL